MPVFVANDPEVDVEPKTKKQRRHIYPDKCATYKKVPPAKRDKEKGTPNTNKLQERTVRCEDPTCWAQWEKDVAANKRAVKGKGMKAELAAVRSVSKEGQALADRAKAARARPKAKA